jgi:hypothetical protein
MGTKRTIANLLVAIGLAGALLGVPHVASAEGGVESQICIALDGSGSIWPDEFALQINGLANAIADSEVVPRDGTVEISVVQFGTYDESGARVEVSATVIDSGATANSVVAAIRAMQQGGDGTPMAAGINLCTEQIIGSPNFSVAPKQIINLSTDGYPNAPGEPSATLAARDALWQLALINWTQRPSEVPLTLVF